MTTVKELIEALSEYPQDTLVAYQYYTEDHLKDIMELDAITDGHWEWAQLALECNETVSDVSSYLDADGEEL